VVSHVRPRLRASRSSWFHARLQRRLIQMHMLPVSSLPSRFGSMGGAHEIRQSASCGLPPSLRHGQTFNLEGNRTGNDVRDRRAFYGAVTFEWWGVLANAPPKPMARKSEARGNHPMIVSSSSGVAPVTLPKRSCCHPPSLTNDTRDRHSSNPTLRLTLRDSTPPVRSGHLPSPPGESFVQ
jgi:hypothetical protein